MKLRDFGNITDLSAVTEFAKQVLEWSRQKITLDDNIGFVKLTCYVGTTETEVGHPLGRVPTAIIEQVMFPNPDGTATGGITMTKAPEANKIFLKRSTSGRVGLILF